MEAAFWHQKWKRTGLAFIRQSFNRWLQSGGGLPSRDEPMLVPLCSRVPRHALASAAGSSGGWLRALRSPLPSFSARTS